MDELLEALVVWQGDRDLEHDLMISSNQVIDCCKSFVTHDEASGLVRFTHFTVHQFIDEVRQKLPEAIHLAKTCLTFLAFTVFGEPCSDTESMEERVHKYKFGLYAAENWGFHTAGEAEESPDIQRILCDSFVSETRRNAILQIHTYAQSNRRTIAFTKGQTLLHVLADKGLATLCKLILDGRVQSAITYVTVTV
jgi:hypothetical protein